MGSDVLGVPAGFGGVALAPTAVSHRAQAVIAYVQSRCSAEFSSCGAHRYALRRAFQSYGGMEPRRHALFVACNPSTADGSKDDRTVRRIAGFARVLGCQSFSVCNLFSYRSTDPGGLLDVRGVEGDPQNMEALLRESAKAWAVVACWGDPVGRLRPTMVSKRAREVLEALRLPRPGASARSPVFCLGVRRDGQPRHPLYLPRDSKLQVLTA